MQSCLTELKQSGGLYKGFSSRFCVGSQVRHETPDEGQRTYRPKRYEYEDEDNSLNILNNKNHQTSSEKFTQVYT